MHTYTHHFIPIHTYNNTQQIMLLLLKNEDEDEEQEQEQDPSIIEEDIQ